MFQVSLHVESVLGVGVRRVFVLGVAGKVVFFRVEGAHPLHLDNAAAGRHDRQLVHAHQLFTTMTSDEFKMVNRTKKAANLFRLAAVADRYWVAGIQF